MKNNYPWNFNSRFYINNNWSLQNGGLKKIMEIKRRNEKLLVNKKFLSAFGTLAAMSMAMSEKFNFDNQIYADNQISAESSSVSNQIFSIKSLFLDLCSR